MGAAYASLSKAQREAGTLCTIGLQVANVNSPPVIAAGTVLVPTDAAQADPYTFKEADFPFSDEDGDDILTVTISPLAVNGTGTLRVGSTAVTADTVVNRANIRHHHLLSAHRPERHRGLRQLLIQHNR